MSKKSGTGTGVLIAGTLGLVGVAGLFIYLDDDLRKRAKDQLSSFLDSSERIIKSFQSLADTVESSHVPLEDKVMNVAAQWDAVESSRRPV